MHTLPNQIKVTVVMTTTSNNKSDEYVTKERFAFDDLTIE